jgi:hypothetical protein
MAPHKSTRVAWSIAVAALALWATSAPVAWGQMMATAERFFQTSTSESTSTTTITQTLGDDATTTVTQSDSQAAPCPTPSSASQEPAPPAAASSSASEGTFHLCGSDAETARQIEQLIGGRSFSATLSAHGDGCADLTIRVTASSPTSGTATSSLSVSLGAGRNLSIQIVSANGATHVNISQAR